MKKSLLDLLEKVDEIIEEMQSSDEPTTVDELDEQTPVPEEAPTLAKWKAAELRVLDVINNTLKQDDAITQEQAKTLLILANVRSEILLHRA